MLNQLSTTHPLLPTAAGFLILVLVALVAGLISKKVLLNMVLALVSRSRATWDDALAQSNVFGRLAQIVPALIVYGGIALVPNVSDTVASIVRNVAGAMIVLVITFTINASLSAFNHIYDTRPDARNRPIKGFIQLIQIVVHIIGAICVIAVLINRSPLIMLSGLGAMTAVSMLVFQDTLLSLVASVQLSSQKMVRVGDWLEMPAFNADGDVIDVALYNVTVQNWDKTITTIPTNKLVYGAYKNWRGMSESGGRRIKRSINLDINSIRLLTDAEVERFTGFALLKDYIASKQAELKAYNTALAAPGEDGVNLRRLTNIGTFRAYIYNYLKNHPKIRNDMTLIVRQLQPGAEGLPIEIYCFSNDTNWSNYEGIQADIFDHVCAIVSEFGLRLYQRPAGADIQRLAESD
jgi:miniconductance mechanosensitive channel